MKRLPKAATAGTLAIILLVGGAGTFARWYQDQDIATSTISTGELSLDVSDADGGWKINTADGNDTDEDPSVAFDPATDKIVPGDIITYTTKVTPTLVGKNLVAELTADLSATGIPADVVSNTGENGKIQVSISLLDASSTAVPATLTPADSGTEYTAVVKFVFPEYTDTTEASSGAADPDLANFWQQKLQKKDIDLSAMAIKARLVQTNR